MTDEPLALVLRERPLKPTVPRNLRRAVVVEYMRDFDIERVSVMFGTTPAAVRRIVNSDEMQKHLERSLGDTSKLAQAGARRLMEVLMEEAMGEKETKGRTEARKLLARHFFPKKVETTNEHRFFVEAPQKLSAEEWAQRYATPTPLPAVEEIPEAEVIDEE